MSTSAVDFPALWLAIALSLVVTTVAIVAQRGGNTRRGWIVGGGLAAVLLALGLVDLFRAAPRDTHLAAAVCGALLPVLGATGMVRATRRARPWLQWVLVFLVALVLLVGGVLLGAAVLPRYLS